MEIPIIFQIIVLVMSVVIHEVAHGYAALAMGDVTAKYAGRLTLNPIKHIDPIGSIIIPGILAILNSGIIFGWAKPVPYNPYNLKNKKWGEVIVAAAGPASNIILAIVFALLIRLSPIFEFTPTVINLSLFIVLINLILAFFNLIPIPPLDGSKILAGFLPTRASLRYREILGGYGFFLVFFIIFFMWQFLLILVLWLVEIMTGIAL